MKEWIFLGVLCAIGLGVLYVVFGKRPQAKIRVPDEVEGVLGKDWQRFLVMCRGDKSAAIRMILLEKQRNPSIDNKQACKIAISRHRRA